MFACLHALRSFKCGEETFLLVSPLPAPRDEDGTNHGDRRSGKYDCHDVKIFHRHLAPKEHRVVMMVNETLSYLAAVSKVYTVALDREGVANKPKFPRRRESAGRVRWLTPEEEAAMLARLDGAERDLFIVLVDIGAPKENDTQTFLSFPAALTPL